MGKLNGLSVKSKAPSPWSLREVWPRSRKSKTPPPGALPPARTSSDICLALQRKTPSPKNVLGSILVPKSAPNTTSPKLLIAPGSKSLMKLPPPDAELPSVASLVKEYPAATACALQKTIHVNPMITTLRQNFMLLFITVSLLRVMSSIPPERQGPHAAPGALPNHWRDFLRGMPRVHLGHRGTPSLSTHSRHNKQCFLSFHEAGYS